MATSTGDPATKASSHAASAEKLGARVRDARHGANLSQKALADRVGFSLWEVESLERGIGDHAAHLDAIAWAVGCPPGSLSEAEEIAVGDGDREPPTAPEPAAPPGPAPSGGEDAQAPRRPPGAALVIGFVSALVLVRFFAETVPVIPNTVASFIDVPLFALLVLIAVARARTPDGEERPPVNLIVPAALFLLLAVVSAVANLGRVALAPTLAFLYFTLAPICVYYAVYRLWPAGNALRFSRALVILGVIQLVVVGAINVPQFLATGDPDVISGTFGENAYQLVFLLLVVTALLAGIATFERQRLGAKLAPVMFAGIAATIFLAQFRALLATTLLTVILIGALLGTAPGRRFRGALQLTVLVAAFVGALTYVADNFPIIKLDTTIASAQSDPWYFVQQRFEIVDAVGELYSDDPRFVLTGSGPGTFSSRAWLTFADTKDSRQVGAPLLRSLTGGPYESDVASKFIAPRLDSEVILGSRALTKPLSSYTSLVGEVGIFGFIALIGAYLLALVAAARLAIRAMRERVPRDPRPGLLLAATIAFAVLLQMAALDNWLEVARITFPSWALLAVAIKEYHAGRPKATV